MSITTDIHDGVATISMDDGKANAVGFDLIAGLNAALDEAEASARAIVLVGREGKFSAGFDLSVLGSGDPQQASRLVTQGGTLGLRLFRSPLPVVAACSGHAIAMGCFLLLSSDLRIGVPGPFKIGANETVIGMTLPVFGQELARARLRPERLTEAIVMGQLYPPDMAVQVGYLDRLSTPEALLPESQAEAARLGELPRAAYKGNKLAMRQSFIDRMAASLDA
jgi:enoyl-CoA hydratase